MKKVWYESETGMEINTSVERQLLDGSWEEIIIVVNGNIYPGDLGRISGPIDQCHPPEPPEVEIVSIKPKVELTTEEKERIEELFFEQAADEEGDILADRMYNDWKDAELDY